MSDRSVYFAVIAPKWRAPNRARPGLGVRPLLRWEVVRETRPILRGGITTSSWEHMSFHWTLRGADRAAQRALREWRSEHPGEWHWGVGRDS